MEILDKIETVLIVAKCIVNGRKALGTSYFKGY